MHPKSEMEDRFCRGNNFCFLTCKTKARGTRCADNNVCHRIILIPLHPSYSLHFSPRYPYLFRSQIFSSWQLCEKVKFLKLILRIFISFKYRISSLLCFRSVTPNPEAKSENTKLCIMQVPRRAVGRLVAITACSCRTSSISEKIPNLFIDSVERR